MLPIVLGLVFIVVFFGFKATNFFTPVNFVNILIQMAGTAMLAFGVVFVLLLGEIDLSISYVAGIGAVTVAELQLPGSGHQINGLLAMLAAIAICVVIGAGQGAIVAYVGVPSFVVTLAGFLIWQGVILQRSRETGLDHHPGPLDQLHGQLRLQPHGRLDHRRGDHRPYGLVVLGGIIGKRRAGVTTPKPVARRRQADRCGRSPPSGPLPSATVPWCRERRSVFRWPASWSSSSSSS